MANNPKLSTKLRNVCLDDGIDAIFDGGILEIYSGTQPATGDAVPGAGTVLATIDPLPTPSFGAGTDGVLAKAGTWEDTSADDTGTAAWFRFKTQADDDSDDSSNKTFARLDGTVGTSGADLNLDSVSITATQSLTINTFTITQPAG